VQMRASALLHRLADADRVMLSACTTAAGEAKVGEALSGFAHAFFHAGARSLLVSHWAGNRESTVRLITTAVDELKRNPRNGRADALRRSMLSMIDTRKDDEPFRPFWAPFMLVGEGGATR
jgi:CHAT domain-containing protein